MLYPITVRAVQSSASGQILVLISMKVKQRIWSLPIISGSVFGLGVIVSALIATGAMQRIDGVGAVDYPYLEKTKAAQTAAKGVNDQLQAAVAEGEASQLDAVAKQADQVRELLSGIGTLPGHANSAQAARRKFEAYYSAAIAAAGIMLGSPMRWVLWVMVGWKPRRTVI